MPRRITEARPVVAESTGQPGRFDLTIITPGTGSSGVYPAETLEAAAQDRAFPKGTHLYVDHPTASETYERPERSVRDLAGVLTEDATWDGERLHAPARIYSMYAPLIAEAAEDIGMSIRASAEVSEDNGQRVVTRITEGLSVDFVTRAGRGGKVAAVLESAYAGLREASVDTEREQLSAVLPRNSFVVDFDPEAGWLIYRSYNPDDDTASTWRDTYTRTDDAATLGGSPTEVRAVTTYVPVAATGSAGQPDQGDTPTATNQEESTMAEIDDAELAALREKADRADAAEAKLNAVEAHSAAMSRASDKLAESKLPQSARDRVTADAVRNLPIGDDGALDVAAFDLRLSEAEQTEADYLTALTEAAGVRGFGQSDPAHVAESTKPSRSPWGRKIQEA